MFKSARIKLTAFYLAIIMAVSVLFSFIVYRGLTLEIARGMRFQALRVLSRDEIEPTEPLRISPRHEFFLGFTLPGNPEILPSYFHRQVFEEAKKRVALQLVVINLSILVLSGISGYFLAGRTLQPIADMVEEQKRFVADASHELRTPLATIRTETEVALRDKKLNLQTAKKQLVSNLEEIDKLKLLTDYFLKLGKYQSAKDQLSWEKFNLATVANDVLTKIAPAAKKKGIKIETKIGKVIFRGNRVSLSELISILLDNAVKYNRDEGKVIFSVGAEKNHAVIKVEDTGIGIAPAHLPYIFNRFYREDSSRNKANASGYGLGLAIAKSIVDLYDGKIKVKSVVNKGSTFTVSLPLAPKSKSAFS